MKIIFLLIAIPIVLAREQSVRINGRLMCHGQPAQYAELQLVAAHTIGGTAFARDVFTDPQGRFEIAGYIDPGYWSDISARLYIWNRCFPKPYEHEDPCFRWFEIRIPRIYVNEGPLAQKAWNLGEIPLEKADQTKQCP